MSKWKVWVLEDKNGVELARGRKKDVMNVSYARYVYGHIFTDNLYRTTQLLNPPKGDTNVNEDYLIYIDGKTFPVHGTTAAWEAYERAINFAELTSLRVFLVDGETGEILCDSWDEE